MLAVSPVIVLINAPVPDPSELKLAVRSGFAVVAQQTPLAVIVPPPAYVTLPPEDADVE